MLGPDSEQRLLDRKDLAPRLTLSPHLLKLSNGLYKIPCVEQVGVNILAPLATVFARTDCRLFQVVTDPLSYDYRTSEFVATVGEINLEILEAIKNLPPEQKTPLGQEDEVAIRIIMQPRLVTTADLLSLLTAEISAPPKLN